MTSLFRHALQMISVVVVTFTLLAYACPLVNPSTFTWLAFFGTAFPWLLLGNLFLALWWAWRRNRFALYHLGIILLGWQFVTGFIGFDFGKDTIPESALIVATHNIGEIFKGGKLTEEMYEKRAAAYAHYLQESGNPDLLCTQETSGKFYRLLAKKMGYEHTYNLKKGTVILSRYPIETGGEIPFGKTYNSTLWADIRIDNKLVRLYNVHLQSNKVTQTTEKVVEKGGLDDEETWHDIGYVLDKVGNATEIRAEQALRLREHIAACKYPVIVCGDFNDTPNSYVYALLSEGLDDTFREKGLGPGTTFAGVLPLLRIDYVLAEKSFTTYSCRVGRDSDFSDHFPVFVALGF
ncbi:MAG: endonuclease/exonuclease/phosphatase family protein [Saprospiraceae bacterium]|nr:endonuclease/exonuclease/phosphatase family protein [Saprospiraceae bacterium]